tara:strand:+ start:1548 stop:1751 length:204 start_codon:yes stop_codon:yes gene_type:complete
LFIAAILTAGFVGTCPNLEVLAVLKVWVLCEPIEAGVRVNREVFTFDCALIWVNIEFMEILEINCIQ